MASGQPLVVQERRTPKPGPGEILVAVKAVALNPADTLMRAHGLFIQTYPAILGFDIAGLVIEAGEGVPDSATENIQGIFFTPGVTRVAAYSAAVFESCDPNYGAFQECCLVPWQHAAPITDSSLSWEQVATLPVSVQVPLCAWDALGLAPAAANGSSGQHAAAANSAIPSGSKEAILIWGASSSVGSMGVQLARLHKVTDSSVTAVYATAGAANHDYVKHLGADRVFDYKSSNLVEDIISAAEKDNLVIRHCYLGKGDVALCQSVLGAFAGGEDYKGLIASAPIVPADTKEVEGVHVIFLVPAMEKTERLRQYQCWMATLSKYVSAGNVKPSPEPRVVGTRLDAINAGLDTLVQGVSCSKLVIKIEK